MAHVISKLHNNVYISKLWDFFKFIRYLNIKGNKNNKSNSIILFVAYYLIPIVCTPYNRNYDTPVSLCYFRAMRD